MLENEKKPLRKKILLFSRDPGGTNTIIPLIKPLKKKYDVYLYGKDVALKKYTEAGFNAKKITNFVPEITIKNVHSFLTRNQFDFIITGTSADDFTEKFIWKAAEAINIPTFAILDNWISSELTSIEQLPCEAKKDSFVLYNSAKFSNLCNNLLT